MLRANASASSASISIVLRQAVKRLAATGIESSELDAQLLLAAAADVDRSALLAANASLSPAVLQRFEAMLQRRESREPVAYILGRREFYSLQFEVNSSVLVPRPETETLVDVALEFLKDRHQARVLDIGTGPGTIATAIAVNAPKPDVVATDVSAHALAVARRNAASNQVIYRINFVQADVFKPLTGAPELGQFDLIVSNPPYIAECDSGTLDPDVRNFEPSVALYGGADGFDVIRRIAGDARSHLLPGGLLALEVGHGQDEAVGKILSAARLKLAGTARDLNGIARVITARP